MNETVGFLGPEKRGEPIADKYRKLISVLAAQRIALWEYDIETKACRFDDGFFRVLGLSDGNVAFSDVADLYRFIHPDDVASYRDAFTAVLASDAKNAPLHVRCVGDKGQIVWLENTFFSSETDELGRPTKLIAYTKDITNQYEKEVRIRNLEERNRKVIEALPEFIFIFDDNFFITDVLMSTDTVLLHPLDELIGVDARMIYSPEVSDLFIRNIRECLSDGQIKEIQYPLDKDGERYYFQARIAPFEGNRVLALIHDVGDRVRYSEELIEAKKRAEQADRMKSVFLATMSHEIRTPLNAIVGFSELIVAGDCDEHEEEYLDIIRRNSNLLLQLINDILELSRIESGKTDTHFQRIEIAGLLDEVEKVHRMKVKGGIELKKEYSGQKFWISTDYNRVMQVLFNFLSNAIKNTERGSITLGMEVKEDWLKLYVRDTGRGIPADKIQMIFSRFEKLNDFVQGTGLGLSICSSIADRLGGHIEVQSQEGIGSTFTLCLPYRPAEVVEPKPDEKTEQESRQTAGSDRKVILVAEDVEANFKLLGALLREDYILRWVPNGQEAVLSFVRERPDLILMDINMPVMNGIEATEKIRTISSDIPILAVTAHAFYTEKQQALAAGCNAVVSKPYSPADLKRTISEWV